MIRFIQFGMVLLGSMLCATAASAQEARTWVSGTGNDINPCSRAAPCLTFAAAISKTAAGGVINCVDPGNYGTVSIAKSITIDCTDAQGTITAVGSSGVTISDSGTGAPGTIRVVLRGLSIVGVNGGVDGIRFMSGASLTVERAIVQNFNRTGIVNAHGIFLTPGAAAEFYVTDTTIVNNDATSSTGIEVTPGAGGSARVVITNARILDNGNSGILLNTAAGAVNATITNSVMSGNAQGIVVVANANAGNAMVVDSEVSQNSGTGIVASGGAARVRIGMTTITGNGTGVGATSGGSINTYGNNRLNGNGTDGAFTLPVLAQQ